jgi:hypothetical protein
MARLSGVLRQLLLDQQSPAGEGRRAGEGTGGPRREDEDRVPSESQVQTSSKLGALLVLLTPFAIAAWVAIGLAIYWLLT